MDRRIKASRIEDGRPETVWGDWGAMLSWQLAVRTADQHVPYELVLLLAWWMTNGRRSANATGVSEHDRFIMELEFVQSLANPHYLHCKLNRSGSYFNQVYGEP